MVGEGDFLSANEPVLQFSKEKEKTKDRKKYFAGVVFTIRIQIPSHSHKLTRIEYAQAIQ